jgi:uncharacterized PurR-regulated membrane protein YhhQ (DUF165 family)
MDTLLLFVLEVTLSLGTSYILISLLKPFLTDVLTEICGSKQRAGFWVMFTQLMLVISPLMIVVFFASTETFSMNNVVHELQQTLFRILLGDFIALCTIGQIIWKSIDSSQNQIPPYLHQRTK